MELDHSLDRGHMLRMCSAEFGKFGILIVVANRTEIGIADNRSGCMSKPMVLPNLLSCLD